MGKKRKGLSKKLRFEVLKRDRFCCQYCNGTPPSVTLEIDHIVPVSQGGGNDIDNLLTACFDCNRGKGGDALNSAPQSLEHKILVQRERLKQNEMYQKFLREERKIVEAGIDDISDYFCKKFAPHSSFNDKSRCDIAPMIKRFGVERVRDAVDITCSNLGKCRPENAFRYMFGIFKNWSKEVANG